MSDRQASPDSRLPTDHVPVWPWLLPLLALAAALRFYAIDHSSFWSDEGNTWALVQRSFAQIAQDTARDIHPPGYYWLLKLWSGVWGISPTALRSFSALCGVLLVALIFVIARRAVPPAAAAAARLRWPLLAALVAALNPFQIYYSQEARMYMLLALEGAALFALLLALLDAQRAGAAARRNRLAVGYALAAAAGLWTHYSFPILIAAAALAWLFDWFLYARRTPTRLANFTRFALANAAALLLFAPWLPTAWRQVTQWPQGGEAIGAAAGLTLTLRTLLFGPLRTVPAPLGPWLAAAGLLPVVAALALRRKRALPALLLWLGAPILLMFALGLFSDAFLKFLLVASPAWCLLAAGAAELAPMRPRRAAEPAKVAAAVLIALGAAAAALAVLPAYYSSPTARDNYKGIAAWLAATGNPTTDLVILDAPGQADVWGAYDPGLPLLALPAQRPADAAATEAALAAAIAGKENVYALFWATDEADPSSLVEGWLNTHLYPGAQSWQGNVRLAQYVQPPQLVCHAVGSALGSVTLTQACTPDPSRVLAGAPLVVGLTWQTSAPLTQTLNVSVQLLDARSQVVAQHDGAAGGGLRPSTTWAPSEMVDDKHALVIPVGTPPGDYALVAALYDANTGVRLAGPQGDALAIGTVAVARAGAFPAALIPMQQRRNHTLGPVTLLGYDQYARGFAHTPETPLHAGDMLHVTLYWQAPDPLPADWPADAAFTLRLGDQQIHAPLAGGSYATRAWQPGEVVRAEFDIPYDGTSRRATLEVNGETMRLW